MHFMYMQISVSYNRLEMYLIQSISCNPFSCFFFLKACTGIDNIAEAITLLELNNWDLVVSSLSVWTAEIKKIITSNNANTFVMVK